MPKEKLKVPKNCPLEIWVSDSDPIEEGCFAHGSVILPPADKYIEITLPDGSKISMPPCIDILVPGQIGLQRFYYFAQGSFNAAFRNFEVPEKEDANNVAKRLAFPPAVFKLPLARKEISVVSALDDPKRHERIFNESNKVALEDACNHSEKAPGKYFFGKAKTLGNGTIAPYIIGKQSTSEKKCNHLIQLYNDEQRIVVDSYVKNNLLTDESGRIWIVDTGYALQLGSDDPIEEQQDAMREEPSPKSKASFCVWSEKNGNYVELYGKHFLQLLFPHEYNQKFPLEKQGEIKKNAFAPPELLLSMALLYIQKEYPEVKDVSCLKDKPELINYFAAAYIEQLFKKYFRKSNEIIPAPEIHRNREKLIGIDEANKKWQELKVLKIELDLIPQKKAPQDFPETPKSAVHMQVSPDGKAIPARAASRDNTLLRTAQLREAKKAILNNIDNRIKQEPYSKIPWTISSETPIANIGILRSRIQQSKDLEDMKNRLQNLMGTQEVQANKALTNLYQASLGAINGFTTKEGIKKEGLKTKFDAIFITKYGEHADKFVPLKTELERQILHYIKSADKKTKPDAYQLIQDIHGCKNEGAIIDKIDKSTISPKCLINCCNIIMKPVVAKYPDDFGYCKNKVAMIELYKARIKANGAEKRHKEASPHNTKLIAQLDKIKAELEYRKTLYTIRGAKNTESWWPLSLNNKLFAVEEMLVCITTLKNQLNSNEPEKLDIALPKTFASKQGKLGKISKELAVAAAQIANLRSLPTAPLAQQPSTSPVLDSYKKKPQDIIYKPSAKAARDDNESSDDEAQQQHSVPAPHQQPSVVPALIKGMPPAHHPVGDFNAAKSIIIQLLEAKNLQGGAYPGVVHDIKKINDEKNAMRILKKLAKDCKDKDLDDRLQRCIAQLEDNFPDLKPPEKSVSNKP